MNRRLLAVLRLLSALVVFTPGVTLAERTTVTEPLIAYGLGA